MTSYMSKDQGNFGFSVHDPFNDLENGTYLQGPHERLSSSLSLFWKVILNGFEILVVHPTACLEVYQGLLVATSFFVE